LNRKLQQITNYDDAGLLLLWPELWPLQIQRFRVRFPALQDFLSSSVSGTGSIQPREINWGATWIKRSSGSRSRKQRLKAVGIRCADHVTPLYPQKLALTSPTGGGRSVGIVRSRTKAKEFSLVARTINFFLITHPLVKHKLLYSLQNPNYVFDIISSYTEDGSWKSSLNPYPANVENMMSF
jgi:hypothetical protein